MSNLALAIPCQTVMGFMGTGPHKPSTTILGNIVLNILFNYMVYLPWAAGPKPSSARPNH